MSPSSLGFMVHSSPCPPPPTPYKDPFFCKTYPEVRNFILQTDCYAQWKSHSITQLVSMAHCYQIYLKRPASRDALHQSPCLYVHIPTSACIIQTNRNPPPGYMYTQTYRQGSYIFDKGDFPKDLMCMHTHTYIRRKTPFLEDINQQPLPCSFAFKHIF